MRIGILEDDEILSELYSQWFAKANHQCAPYKTVAAYIEALLSENFDLLLIDMMLPDGTGDDVLKWVRKNLGWELPVVFVTAIDEEEEIVNTLRLGANDYVVKPPKYAELIARVEGLVRAKNGAYQPVMKFGAYEIYLDQQEIHFLGERVDLTQKEYELTSYLFQNPSRLLSRLHLLETVWGVYTEVDSSVVDNHIRSIRKKLGLYPQNGWDINSIYGYGYRIEKVNTA